MKRFQQWVGKVVIEIALAVALAVPILGSAIWLSEIYGWLSVSFEFVAGALWFQAYSFIEGELFGEDAPE